MIEIEDFELNTATIKLFPELEDITLTPTTEVQEFNHPDSYGYDKITLEAIKLQEKAIEPSKEIQEIIPEESYDGLKKVTVNAISEEYVIPEGTLEITTNGKYDVTEKAEVDVNIDMELPIINDASNLFYKGARLNEMEKFLLMCKNVTYAYAMFDECKTLIKLDLKNFNTSSITSMQSMFDTCENLTEIDISTFDTSKNQTMMAMFNGCKKLNKINVSSFNTSNVTYFTNMFALCENLTEIDISTFDTSKASSTNGMFSYCKNLKKVIINNSSVFKMTNTTMLSNTPIASGTGYVYVPDNLIETYRQSTNWSTYANQIKGISELPAEEA